MGRAPCCDKDGLKKGPWLPEEDQKLIDFIAKHGPGNWRTLPKKAGLERCGKSCRLRWTNYLRPDIKRGRFTFEEEETIIQLHSLLGNKWSAIAAKLPGRTDNEIKNYWNTHIRKRLLRMGIDPVTHTRKFDFLDLPSMLNSIPHDSSQLNLLKLLSLQSLVNPELLRLASFLSTNSNQGQQHQGGLINFPTQNLQETQHNNLMQNQYNNNPIEQISNQVHTSFQTSELPCAPIFVENEAIQQCLHQSNAALPNLGHWENKVLLNNEHNNAIETNNEGPYFSDIQGITEFLLNGDNQSLSMSSVLSTPCTSQQQTPLSSNEYHNSSSTTTTSSEDEIDSYCQNLMNNFEIPVDLFNVY